LLGVADLRDSSLLCELPYSPPKAQTLKPKASIPLQPYFFPMQGTGVSTQR
jgi:hypothetical protein